jgi:hypothetical protein
VANTSVARSSSSARHCPIWFGQTLYCSDKQSYHFAYCPVTRSHFCRHAKQDRLVQLPTERHATLNDAI